MQITKHTPGPWTAATHSPEGTDILTNHHDNCCGVMATVHNQPGEDVPGTVDVANARLIAAAPDLLAFVRTFAQGSTHAIVGGRRQRQAEELITQATINSPYATKDYGEE